MGKMYVIILFYFRNFEWICFCVKWKKQQFILPLSILQWLSRISLIIYPQPRVFGRVLALRAVIGLLPALSCHRTQQLSFLLAQEVFGPLKISQFAFLLGLCNCSLTGLLLILINKQSKFPVSGRLLKKEKLTDLFWAHAFRFKPSSPLK